MKLAAAGLILVSSALVAGCAVYPDGTPAYAGGGYSSYPAYPGGYDPGYYGGPVVQSGVVIGGGYYGGPGPRWDDSPGYRRPPPGGWNDRGDRDGNRGGNRGGDRGDRGDHGGRGGQQAGGPQGGPQGGHGGQQAGGGNPQGGRPPQAGGPGAQPQPQPQQQQARTPYVGRSNWGKPSPQTSERNH